MTIGACLPCRTSVLLETPFCSRMLTVVPLGNVMSVVMMSPPGLPSLALLTTTTLQSTESAGECFEVMTRKQPE